MSPPSRAGSRLVILLTVLSTAVALLDAVMMRDRVRLVDVLLLFFGGVGTGAGIAILVAERRARRLAPEAVAARPAPLGTAPHTPPTVLPRRDDDA